MNTIPEKSSQHDSRVPPEKTELAVRWAQILFYVNAAIWLAFGLLGLILPVEGNQASAMTRGIVAVMMFANAGTMALIGWALAKRPQHPARLRLVYYLALVVLLVNIVLTVTDQFGLLDLLVLLVDLALLALLLFRRSAYLDGGVGWRDSTGSSE